MFAFCTFLIIGEHLFVRVQYYLDMGSQYLTPATQNYFVMTGAVTSVPTPDTFNYLLMSEGDKEKNGVNNGKRFSSAVDSAKSNNQSAKNDYVNPPMAINQSAKNDYVNPPMGTAFDDVTVSGDNDNYIPAMSAEDLNEDLPVVTTTSENNVQQNHAAKKDFSAGYVTMF